MISKKQNKVIFFALSIATLGGATFFLFYQLTTAPIRIYDEAIYANNALEMTLNGDYWIMKREGEPTLYNTKPPFVIWLQSLSMHLFGINEFAVRIPSALAGFGVFLAILLFGICVLKKPLIGIFGILTLICCDGFITGHVTRTGDLDSVLNLFITLYTLLTFKVLLSPIQNLKKQIILIGTLIFFAFFTKSTAGLIPLLGLLFVVLLSSKRKEILTNKWLYITTSLGIGLIISFYFYKESIHAGYWNKVFESEFGRINNDIMSWQHRPWHHYLKYLVKHEYFYPFIFGIPVLIISIFFSKNQLLRKFVLFGLVWVITYFVIISYPKVKLWWYATPIYPMLSLLIGVLIFQVWEFVKTQLQLANSSKVLLFLLFIAAIYFQPLKRNWQRIKTDTAPLEFQEKPGDFMREVKKQNPQIKNYSVLIKVKYDEHEDVVNFYQQAFNNQHNYQIKKKQKVEELETGETVLVCQWRARQAILEKFEVTELQKGKHCNLYLLNREKEK